MFVGRFSTSGLARSYVDLLAAEGTTARVIFKPRRGRDIKPFVVERIQPTDREEGVPGDVGDPAGV